MQDAAVRVSRLGAPGQPTIGGPVELHPGNPDKDLFHEAGSFLGKQPSRLRRACPGAGGQDVGHQALGAVVRPA